MAAESLADRLDQLIADIGPIPVSVYVEAALYDADAGFYTAGGGQAGRRGDFLTAPEVGPLFGHVIGRALDSWWRDAGEPDSFIVHEWGAGPGTLARSVIDGEPEVLVSGALQWVAIERSDPQRDRHPEHPAVRSAATLPATSPNVVLANELVDNLPFDIHERTAEGWCQLLVDERGDDGRFTEVHDEVDPAANLPDLATRARVPVINAGREWLADVLATLQGGGRVVVFDYGADTAVLAARGLGWLRTHVAHGGESDWLVAPGSCDITTDVPFDQLTSLRDPVARSRQDDWLRRHGIDELVEAGRRQWEESASVGDLAALKARSRVREADALLDPDGMGQFEVLEWLAE